MEEQKVLILNDDATKRHLLDMYGKAYDEVRKSGVLEVMKSIPYAQSFPPAVTVVRATPKIGRNEPCPCGSGVKFKKCCGRDL